MNHTNIYDNFTVIIPAHNRPDHLRRLLEYYTDYGVKVIVSDSSHSIPSYIEEFQDKINYYFYPNTPLAFKLFKILPAIKTPYALMCADDDFIAPESIKDLVSFLEINPSYNSGQGIFLSFNPSTHDINLSVRYINSMNVDLNEDQSSKRLISLMDNYFQYYYAVFRTDTFKEIIESTIQDGNTLINNLCLLELYISSYGAILGKHMISPVFYAAREDIINSAASFTDNMLVVIKEEKYKQECENYINLLAQVLAIKDHISQEEARNIILASLELYISKIPMTRTFTNKIKKKAREMINKLHMQHFIARRKKIDPAEVVGFYAWSKMEYYVIKYNYIYK